MTDQHQGKTDQRIGGNLTPTLSGGGTFILHHHPGDFIELFNFMLKISIQPAAQDMQIIDHELWMLECLYAKRNGIAIHPFGYQLQTLLRGGFDPAPMAR